MAFFKFRRGGQLGNEGRGSVAAAPTESVEAMRRRARHRLLGAAVLVLIGVIGFPLLFDTQPRPISVDIPIEIPDRNKAKPLALPATPPATSTSSAKPAGKSDPDPVTAPAGDGMITEAADGSEISPGKVAAATGAAAAAAMAKPEADARPQAKADSKPDAKPKADAKPETKAAAKPDAKADTKVAAAKPSAADDGVRARALLDGKPPSAAPAAVAASPAADDNGRFVIQVGAFADADKAREVRQKLEKAGLKTYTNVAKTADGERTRVRVGPFASRAEADRAAGKVKGLSLPAAVLSL